MAIERTLSDVNQEDFDVAEAKIISAILELNPSVDLRNGTALRDLLVRQGAILNAYNEKLNEDLRNTQSLAVVTANPELADDDVVEGILSNINVIRKEGTSASGLVMITVGSNSSFAIPANYIFTTSDNLSFTTLQTYRVRPSDSFTGALDELQLKPHTDTAKAGKYFAVVPVVAALTGSIYNVSSGVALTTLNKLVTGTQEQETYNTFVGGTDKESLEALLARVPTALGQKSMESQQSITSTLQTKFSTIRELSAVGFGDEAQLRDKHNIFGSAMGGKVDLYIRPTTSVDTLTLVVQATKASNSIYYFTLTSDQAPGAQLIRSITAPDSINPSTPITPNLPIIGSLPFTTVRSTGTLGDSYHDFATNNLAVETAFSAYQKLDVFVTDVPPVTVGGVTTWPTTVDLKLEVYVPPLIREIQTYVDQEDTRNLKADHVVRSYLPFFVSLDATVIEKPGVTSDVNAMRKAVADYINTKTFGDILTASQINCVLHTFDIISVKKLTFSAYTIDAANNVVTLTGSAMSIEDVKKPQYLVDVDTAMFVADIRDIFVKAVEA